MEKETNGNVIVRRIDSILVMKNDTRANLCRELGMKQPTFSTWLARGTMPKADELYQIAKYLNVSMEWLLYGEDSGKLANDEILLLDKWRDLTADDKEEIMHMIDFKAQKKDSRNSKCGCLGEYGRAYI